MSMGEKDDTDLMMKVSIEASSPDHEDKEKLWNKYVRGEMVQKQFKCSSKYFYNIDDEAECIRFGDKFFDVVEQVFRE